MSSTHAAPARRLVHVAGALLTGALLALGLIAACATSRRGPAVGARSAAASAADSAFATVQARGTDPRGMGVDQATSLHRFDALADGGRIELQREVHDSAGVVQVRRHLRGIATAFAAGDFSTPAFVHMRTVPGTSLMAVKRAVIAYTVADLARGGEVRIVTRDPEALAAVHAFIAFQRQDHRAGGARAPGDPPIGHAHPISGHPGHSPP